MKILSILTIILTQAVNCIPNDFEELVVKGDSLYAESNMVGALDYYKEAYKINSTDYFLLFKLSRTCNDLGEYYYELRDKKSSERVIYEAVKYSEKFSNLYPDSAKVYAHLAWSYGNLALFEGGSEKIKLVNKIKYNAEKAIEMDSTDYLAYLILGITYRNIGALSWVEKLLANTFLGNVPEGSFKESEKFMLKVLELQPGIVIAAFHLSLTYREMGEEEKEIKMLRKVIELPEINFRDKFAKHKAEIRLKELLK